MSDRFEPIGLYGLSKPLLFSIPPETAHSLSLQALGLSGKFSWSRALLRTMFAPSNDPISLFGKELPNRIGLAAGYDKNATALDGLEAMGFGHIEIGTIVPKPQPGNPSPRVHRLPQEFALVNRLGFPSQGLDVISRRIEGYLNRREKRNIKNQPSPMLGINIGRNKLTPNEDAHKDYLECFLRLSDFADYCTINISSPNTPNLRKLQNDSALKSLLTPILNARINQEKQTPLLVKLSPDLSSEHRIKTLHTLVELGIEGVVLSNTKRTQEPWEGGLSGAFLHDNSLRLITEAKTETPSLRLIASGGIGQDNDVQLFTEAGADLVQVWTALLYRGPKLLQKL